MDLKLDPVSHDLVFVNGATPVTIDRTDAVVQRLYMRLRTFLSDWYLNDSYGTPWFQRILGHKTKKSTVDMILQKEILDVVGVGSIVHFESQYDNASRKYSCTFSVKTDEGDTSPEINIKQ